VVRPSLRLLIRPKVGLVNVFFLLGFGPRLTRWGEAQFPYEEDPDLFKAVAWVFESEVRHALAQGLIRGYQARSETLTALRGRIDLAGQLAPVRAGRSPSSAASRSTPRTRSSTGSSRPRTGACSRSRT
jgi:hypothetical protein